MSTFWFVDVLVCRRFGLSTFWFVDVSVCRRFGLSSFWSVDVLVCRRFGLSTFRFVDVLTSYLIMYPCPNFNGGIFKLSLQLGNRWVITSSNNQGCNYLFLPTIIYSLLVIKRLELQYTELYNGYDGGGASNSNFIEYLILTHYCHMYIHMSDSRYFVCGHLNYLYYC